MSEQEQLRCEENRFCQISKSSEPDGDRDQSLGFKTPELAESLTPQPESESPKNEVNLLELPMDILERIVLYLSGSAAISLQNTSQSCIKIVQNILGRKRGSTFWKQQCFAQTESSLLSKIFASYFNVVEEKKRLSVQKSRIWLDARLDNTYEDVFHRLFNLHLFLKNSTLQVEKMSGPEGEIKSDIWVKYEKAYEKQTYPKRFTSTAGSILFNIMSPRSRPECEPNCVHIFENMKVLRRETVIPGVDEILLDYKIMILPIKKSINRFLDEREPLVKVWTIFIGIFENFIYLSALNEGIETRIPLGLHAGYMQFKKMQAPVAIYKEFLGVWANPDFYRMYCISVDPEKGLVQADLIMDITFRGIYRLWQIVAAWQEHFIPYFIFSADGLPNYLPDTETDVLPVFALLSPRFGSLYFLSEAFNRRDQNLNILDNMGDYELHLQRGKCLESFDLPMGKTSGHGVYLFWYRNGLAFGFSEFQACKWYFMEWELICVKQNVVSLVEIIAPHIVMLCTPVEIIIVHLLIDIPDVKEGVCTPLIRCPVIRRIQIGYIGRNGYIENFHFDFDKGTPYIFLTLRSRIPNPKLPFPYDFAFRKITFSGRVYNSKPSKSEGEEVEREFPEIPISYFLHPKNKRLVSLLKTFGVDNC